MLAMAGDKELELSLCSCSFFLSLLKLFASLNARKLDFTFTWQGTVNEQVNHVNVWAGRVQVRLCTPMLMIHENASVHGNVAS